MISQQQLPGVRPSLYVVWNVQEDGALDAVEVEYRIRDNWVLVSDPFTPYYKPRIVLGELLETGWAWEKSRHATWGFYDLKGNPIKAYCWTRSSKRYFTDEGLEQYATYCRNKASMTRKEFNQWRKSQRKPR